MAKIPDQFALGQPRWSSPTSVARYDAKAAAAPGRAQAQLGNAIAGMGKSLGGLLSAVGERDEQNQKYETAVAFLNFDQQQNDSIREAERNIAPDGSGFRESVAGGYDGAAREFFKNVPDKYKGEYDYKLRQRAVDYERRAREIEYKQSDTFHLENLKSGLDNEYSGIDNEPDRVTDYIGRGLYRIENSRLPENRKREMMRKFGETAESRHLAARIKAGEDPDQIKADIEQRVRPQWDPDGRLMKDVTPGPQSMRGPAKSFAQPVETAIADAAKEVGVDPGLMRTYAQIESSGNPSNRTGSYKGLFRLSDDEFAKYGVGGDIFNPGDNARAAARKFKAESATFQGKFGREPTATDLYLMHQQGFGGLTAHLENPDAPAWKNMLSTSEGRQKGERWSKQAIWGNVPSDVKEKYGSVEKMTSRDFVAMWDDKVSRIGGSGTGHGGGSGQQTAGKFDKPVEFLKAKLAPGYEKRVSDVTDLHPAMQDRLGAFLAAAEDAGHDIRVVSGQRSPERQAVLWQNALKKYGSADEARKHVAPPGGSSHQSGEAVDLQYQDRKPGLGGTKTAAVEWAHKNAAKYGLNFPLGHEDWHIEPNEAREGGKRYGGKYDTKTAYWKPRGDQTLDQKQPSAPVAQRGLTAFAGMSRDAKSEEAAGPDKVTVSLKGLNDEQKAAALDKVAAAGYRDFTYILDDNERIVAKRADKFNWGPTGRSPVAQGAGPADVNDPKQFAGPSWANGVIGKLQAGDYDKAAGPVRVADASGALPASAIPTSVVAEASGDEVARLTGGNQIATILDGIPDDQPLSALPDDVRDKVMRLLPKDALTSHTMPDGSKVSGVDAVTVGEVKEGFAANLQNSQRLAEAGGPDAERVPGLDGQGVPQVPRQTKFQYQWLSQKAADKMLRDLQIAQRNHYLKSGKGEEEFILKHGVESRDDQGRTLVERSRGVLMPNQLKKLQQDIDGAKWRYQMVAPIPNLSDDALTRHLEKMEPTPADAADLATYEAKSEAYKAAVRAAEKVRELRASDAATAVEASPEVKKAREAIKAAKAGVAMMGQDGEGNVGVMTEERQAMTPREAWESLIDARIEAQGRIFGDKGDPRTRTITRREAQSLLQITKASEMSEDELTARLKEGAARADRLYGRHARRVFDDAVRMVVSNKQGREDAAGFAQKLIRGEPITAADVHRYQMLQDLGPSDAFMVRGLAGSQPDAGGFALLPAPRPMAPAPGAGADMDPGRGRVDANRMPAMPGGFGVPQQGAAVPGGPPAHVIERVLRDPERYRRVFDGEFGAGATDKLMQWAKSRQPSAAALPFGVPSSEGAASVY